jgi:arsenate reductase
MKELGIDISNQSSKSLDQFVNQSFDYVITVCDIARESCPVFYGAKKMLHWSIEDPVGIWGTTEMQLEAFRKARDEIKKRIEKTFNLRQRRETHPTSSK